MTARRDIQEAQWLRDGFRTAAADDAASEGDVATVGADGEMEFAASGGDGGSQPWVALTEDDGAGNYTTDPDDFTVLPLIDCGGPCFVYMRSTLKSWVSDGETVGPVDPTDIYFDLSNFQGGRLSNALNGPAAWLTDWRGWDVNSYMSAVDQWIGVVFQTERFAQPWLQVFQNAAVYEGANNPTGTMLVEAWKLDMTPGLPA